MSAFNLKYIHVHLQSKPVLAIIRNLIFTFSDCPCNKRIVRAIRFEHRAHTPKVTQVLWLTASHIRVTCAKQSSCLLHWLSMFKVAVPLFRFTLRKNH